MVTCSLFITAESDYTRVTQILEFQSEETVKQITLEVYDDKNAEQNETFELYLTPGAGVHLSPHPRVIVVITNDDFGKPEGGITAYSY